MKLLFENFRKFVGEGGFSGNGPLAEPIEEVEGEVQFKPGWGKDEEGNIRRDDYDQKDHPHHSKADPHTAALKKLDDYLFKNAHVYEDDLVDAFHDLNTSVMDYEDAIIGQDEFLPPKETLAQDVANNLSKFSSMVAETEDTDLKNLFDAASRLIVGMPAFLKEIKEKGRIN